MEVIFPRHSAALRGGRASNSFALAALPRAVGAHRGQAQRRWNGLSCILWGATAARALSISPRTVEIHRGNMMTKLGAGRAADAVRLWIDARAGGASVPAIRRHEEREAEDIVVGRIGGRLADEPIPQPGRRQRQ